jgi:diacylglycerol kinase family enzyme
MWSYAKPILASIRTYEYPELRIYCDSALVKPSADETVPMLARWAFVANLPCYAGGLSFAPNAVATDGLLNVCSFRRGSLWHGLRYLAHVWAGQHVKLDDCDRSAAGRVRIESHRPVRFQLDGDPGGMLPLDIQVLPARLSLVAPPRWTEVSTPVRRKISEVMRLV